MPKWLEEELARSATNSDVSGKARDAYIYGTMNKIKKAWKRAHPNLSLTKANFHRKKS